MSITQFLRAAALGLFLAACAQPAAAPAAEAPAQADGLHREVVVVDTAGGSHTFYAEIADDEAERNRGLMFRRDMPRDNGMLFQFQEPEQLTFWMRNTPLPLDLIFITRDGTILNIAERATPYSDAGIASAGPASAVLEINGGLAREMGIAPGDRVRHPFFTGN